MLKVKRVTYHIVPSKKAGGWIVKKVGLKRILNSFTTKAKAIKLGKRLAKHEKFGQLVIHKKGGRIQTEYTYGADPRYSRG